MTETQTPTQATSVKRTVGLVLAGVVLIAGVVFGAIQLSGGGESPAPSGGTSQNDEGGDVKVEKPGLSAQMGGQAAIDEMGDRIDSFAARNNMTAEELKELLLKNPSAQITKTGAIIFVDPGTN